MELSKDDVERLEKTGHARSEFTNLDRRGILRLRNDRGYCIFYDTRKRICQVYANRPLGCCIYPVIYRIGEGIIVDDLCPMKSTVSSRELKTKSKKLTILMQRLSEDSRMSNTSTHLY